MARKARQRISYVLPLNNAATGGHRLGVNGLAVDTNNSLLYSAGRDGAICAWDLHLDLTDTRPPLPTDPKAPAPPATTLRQQVQAHTHWINDIALAKSNQALVSASSDITVKVWRPAAQDTLPPQTIGLHTDYVKVLAVPDAGSDWVASGGLDRRICLWDLNGSGQRLSIDVSEDEGGAGVNKDKGSVYALGVTQSILASGGPESTVRVWDPKSGKRITKFVGHTDNVRDILVSHDGSTIMTASSDQTVKVWSVTAGRCMHTLTMHDTSVWSLWSTHPDLSVFYSSDKSGMVVKTDTRGCAELDEGLSVAVCQEQEGVHKLICEGDYIWTATSRPSINRWTDVDTTDAEPEMPENFKQHRFSVTSARLRTHSSPNLEPPQSPPRDSVPKKQIPIKHLLRLSNAAYFPAAVVRDSEADEAEHVTTQSYRSQPGFSIEGQNGLIKHVMLNDRKRVLTLDTAGEVVMWDLLKCVPIKSFGKRHLEDVQPEVSTVESVANWCTVDTRTGSLAVVLEENTCFDAEMYADELELDHAQDLDFKEDQRINLGKWVLRYLFASVITEEVQRDQAFRKYLLNTHQQQRLERANAPTSIQLPGAPTNGWHQNGIATPTATTPRGTNGMKPFTPGMGIGQATPGLLLSATKSAGRASEDGTPLDRPLSNSSQPRKSADYFSTTPHGILASPGAESTMAETPALDDKGDAKTSADDAKDTPSKFGKKFKMNMTFGMKKLSKSSTGEKEKATVVEEKEKEEESDSRSSKTSNSRVVDDNLLGTVQKIRFEYRDYLVQQAAQQSAQEAAGGALGVSKTPVLESSVTPSVPSETPVLQPPANTTILIQEDRPEAGGVADLFEGTVGGLASAVDQVEKLAPMWLGDVLLRNQLPLKDIVKISFVLEPWQNKLPSIAADGNNRLNANRMLRARKILAYVAERIEPAPADDAEPDDSAMKPEEYLELWCQNQLVPPRMTLATIRTNVWRGGGDVMLYYKANGKKEILHTLPQETAVETAP